MKFIFKKEFLLVLTVILFLNSAELFGLNAGNDGNSKVAADSAVETITMYFETENPDQGEQIIREDIQNKFPIISETDLNKIVSSRTVTRKENGSDTGISSASEMLYKVAFEVPKNFLEDTAKILWELNIPEFQSRIYQLYKNKQIYIDTWPNVVGTIKDKTYTGNFQAYRVRNWPFYKDPDPSKRDLPPTPPGTKNPLGLFVVHYDENSLRYFHGTNKPTLLNNTMRNLSHGCIRNDNDNIEKMKEFIIKRVVKSKDLSDWLGSKKTLIYDFEEIDKFPVRIIYKTFDVGEDLTGKYFILFKDIYNYQSGRIDTEWNDEMLITLTTNENLFAEYREEVGKDIPDEALNMIIDYLINSGKLYEKYYVEDLKQTFMLKN